MNKSQIFAIPICILLGFAIGAFIPSKGRLGEAILASFRFVRFFK